MVEGGIQNEGTRSKVAVGSWHRTTNFDTEFSGRTHYDNSGLYLIGETGITDRWAGFFQLGNADKDRNQIGFYVGAGLVCSDLLMADDVFGIGLARAENSDEYLDSIAGAKSYEMSLECAYKFHPCPWMTLQPGLQLIKNPGMDPDLDDAVAFSCRAYVSF